MKMERLFQINKVYSINANPARCVSIRSMGQGPLWGTQVATLVGVCGTEYKLTRWPSGDIYRVSVHGNRNKTHSPAH